MQSFPEDRLEMAGDGFSGCGSGWLVGIWLVWRGCTLVCLFLRDIARLCNIFFARTQLGTFMIRMIRAETEHRLSRCWSRWLDLVTLHHSSPSGLLLH